MCIILFVKCYVLGLIKRTKLTIPLKLQLLETLIGLVHSIWNKPIEMNVNVFYPIIYLKWPK
jgi:hypothetical protein